MVVVVLLDEGDAVLDVLRSGFSVESHRSFELERRESSRVHISMGEQLKNRRFPCSRGSLGAEERSVVELNARPVEKVCLR